MSLFRSIITLLATVALSKKIPSWNEHNPTPISQLALVTDEEFTFQNFTPPLFVRSDGSKFMSVALVDSSNWINLALNSLVSMARFQSIDSVTIMTEEDDGLIAKVFTRIGFYVYNANPIIATFPPAFGKDKRIPNWSWGEIIFLRYNLWFESFRRGIGFCSLDLDVAYNQDVFFGKVGGSYVDITMQGQLMPKRPEQKSDECIYTLAQFFTDKFGYYVNPGLACHAYNKNTFMLMQDMQRHIMHSIRTRMGGWGQFAYDRSFCEGDFTYASPTADQHRWKWRGQLKKYNVSVSLFHALATTDSKVSEKDRRHVPAYHAKACHGEGEKSIADPLFRVHCKEDWLKQEGQWFLPPDTPTTLEGWLNADIKFIHKIQTMLFQNITQK